MTRRLKIIADNNIPFLKGVLEPYAAMEYIKGSDISKAYVKEADAMIIRTRTKCNEALLEGTNIRFIATATIGADHIDADYCKARNIKWINAPGCNAGSVMQYMASVLMRLKTDYDLTLSRMTLGVVGFGHVGSKVVKLGRTLGMKVLINDPPLQRAGVTGEFTSLNHLMEQADIISFHVPLNLSGPDKTLHLANKAFFDRLKKKPFIINSSRGEVHDTAALKIALKKFQVSGAVLDVWENEPSIDQELLELVEFATPHIAGYSADGKANGTAMSVNALSEFFGLELHPWFPESIPAPDSLNLKVEDAGLPDEAILRDLILTTYDVKSDDSRLRNNIASFETLRAEYPLRREFHVFNVQKAKQRKSLDEKLSNLGFNVVT
jgi:erythronate-4-phosphate dehydrogenase